MSEIDLCELPRRTKEKRREIIIMYENGDSEYKISRKTKKPVTEIRIIIYKYKKMKALIQRKKVPQRSLSESYLQMIKEVSPDMKESIQMMISIELDRQLTELVIKSYKYRQIVMENGSITEEKCIELAKDEKRIKNIYKFCSTL